MDTLPANSDHQPTRQALEAVDRSHPGRVTGKLKRALDHMVWDGEKRDDAAALAGMSVHGLREALKKTHVKVYLREQLQVLRENERPRNIHALVDIRDNSGNAMARVGAVKALEQLADDAERPGGGHGASSAPGLTVVINVPQAVQTRPDMLLVHDAATSHKTSD